MECGIQTTLKVEAIRKEGRDGRRKSAEKWEADHRGAEAERRLGHQARTWGQVTESLCRDHKGVRASQAGITNLERREVSSWKKPRGFGGFG